MGTENPITREECTREKKAISDSIIRIHDRVDKVEKTADQIEISAKNIEKCVYKIEQVMYGSEKADGIIMKVSNLGQKVNGAFWFFGVVIVALVTSLVGIIIGTAFHKSTPP